MVAAYQSWLRAAGPWRLWMGCLPLLGPGLPELEWQQSAAKPEPPGNAIFDLLRRELADAPAMLLLDLSPERGVVLASRLWSAGLARPLLVLGRFPYREAVLPGEAVLNALVDHAPAKPVSMANRARSVAVVLDAESAPLLPDRAERDHRADNRYLLLEEDLPEPAAWVRSGLGRVLHVVRSAGPTCMPASYLARLAESGLSVRRVEQV